jgi:hypothetical protein
VIAERLLGAPGPRRFIENICADLAQRQNVVVLLPKGVTPDSLWQAVRGHLWQRGMDLFEVPSELLVGSTRASIDAVARSLGVSAQGHTITSLEDLRCRQNLPDVVGIVALDHGDAGEVDSWVHLVRDWAGVGHRQAGSGQYRPVFFLPLVGERMQRAAPAPEVCLAVHSWQGAFSSLDLRQLWRLETRVSGGQGPMAWAEHMTASLAADDLELTVRLDAALFGTFGDIYEALLAAARERGWTAGAARAAAASLRSSSPAARPAAGPAKRAGDVWAWWAEGLVRVTPEYGMELSSACLPLLEAGDQLRHRCWRAQIALVLPLIDRVRLRLCGELTARFGDRWVLWRAPANDDERARVARDPSGAQLRHLEMTLLCPDASGFLDWLAIIREARYVRNELAHHRPILYADFERLTGLADDHPV